MIADRERIDAAYPASGVDATVDWQAARIFGGSGIGFEPVYRGWARSRP